MQPAPCSRRRVRKARCRAQRCEHGQRPLSPKFHTGPEHPAWARALGNRGCMRVPGCTHVSVTQCRCPLTMYTIIVWLQAILPTVSYAKGCFLFSCWYTSLIRLNFRLTGKWPYPFLSNFTQAWKYVPPDSASVPSLSSPTWGLTNGCGCADLGL